MKNTNTNKKNVNRTNNKKTNMPFNYRPANYGAIKYQSMSKKILYMLRNTKLSQSEIARRCEVSQPCVCQLAATLKK